MTTHYISAITVRRLLQAYKRGNVCLVALSDSQRERDSRVTSVRWLVRQS